MWREDLEEKHKLSVKFADEMKNTNTIEAPRYLKEPRRVFVSHSQGLMGILFCCFPMTLPS